MSYTYTVKFKDKPSVKQLQILFMVYCMNHGSREDKYLSKNVLRAANRTLTPKYGYQLANHVRHTMTDYDAIIRMLPEDRQEDGREELRKELKAEMLEDAYRMYPQLLPSHILKIDELED